MKRSTHIHTSTKRCDCDDSSLQWGVAPECQGDLPNVVQRLLARERDGAHARLLHAERVHGRHVAGESMEKGQKDARHAVGPFDARHALQLGDEERALPRVTVGRRLRWALTASVLSAPCRTCRRVSVQRAAIDWRSGRQHCVHVRHGVCAVDPSAIRMSVEGADLPYSCRMSAARVCSV